MIEFGQKLKQARIQKKITQEEISFKTKINISYLNAIEEGNIAKLPEAYFKMFIKTYAKVLDVRLPNDFFEDDQKKAKENVESAKITDDDLLVKYNFFLNKEKIIRIITNYRNLIFIILILFMIMIIFTAYNLLFKSDEIPLAKEPAIKVITVNSDKNHQISVNVRDSIKITGTTKISDSLSFYITAIDSSYLLYFNDTEKVRETMLIPGNVLALKAESLMEIKVGNSKGVELEYDGHKVLKELKNNKKSSAFIKVTQQTGVQKVKESKKIQEYLRIVYGMK